MRASPSTTVVINALSARLGGGITVAQRLSVGLAHLKPEWRFIYLYSTADTDPKPRPDNLLPVLKPRLVHILARTAWEQFYLPRLLHRWDAQATLNLSGFVYFSSAIPQVAVWQNPNIFSESQPSHQPWSERAYIFAQRLAQAASMRRAAQNVFLTWHSVGMARRVWNLDRLPHTVIYSGIDVVAPPATGVPPIRADDLIVAIGHTYFHKNYETLIDAIAHLRKKLPSRFRLQIIGGAYHFSYHRSLIERVDRLQLSDVVEFTGALPASEVISRLRRATVYVTTSTLETFGLTPLEAMSQGTPVVASRASCIPEVCGDAAIYCDPENPVDVARALEQFLCDPDLRRDFQIKGFQRARRFSWEATAKLYLAQLESAIQRKR